MSDDTRIGAEAEDATSDETPAAVPAADAGAETPAAGSPAYEPAPEPAAADTTDEVSGSEPLPELVEPPDVRASVFAPPASGIPDAASQDASDAYDSTTADKAVTEEPVAAEPVTTLPESQPAPIPAVQTVYVTAPNPPRARGNRGIGTLLAVAATIVFAVLLALIAALYRGIAGGDGLGAAFTDWLPGFLTVPLFYAPVAVFLVLFVLFVLLANRAGWGVYVLGSFLLAAALYFASIGILLALDGMVFNFTGQTSFASLALNPAIVIATVVAREVAIWFGAAISSRGRRVKARNLEAAAAYERETAETKAEIERSQYGTLA